MLGMAALLACLALPAAAAQGATIAVTAGAADSDGDEIVTPDGDTACSLREAVLAANQDSTSTPLDVGDCTLVGTAGADQINVPTGTVTLTIAGCCDTTGVNGDLNVTDSDGLTIAGTGNPVITQTTTGERIIEATEPLTLSGLTVSDGVSNFGGNIRFAGGAGDQLHLAGTIVEDGVSNASPAEGGGIYVDGSNTTTLIDDSSVIRNNHATPSGIAGHGGGIAVQGTNNSLTVTDSQIVDNDAGVASAPGEGGGIYYSSAGQVTLTNTQLNSNDAGVGAGSDGTGGGAFVDITNANLTVTGGQVNDNKAGGLPAGDDGDGGGLALFGSPPTTVDILLDGVTITGNKAGENVDVGEMGRGGGVFLNAGPNGLAKLTVTDSTVSSNTAGTATTFVGTQGDGKGGGLHVDSDGEMNISDSVISGNLAAQEGGGIYRNDLGLFDSSSDEVITRTRISDNSVGTSFTVPHGGGISADVPGGGLTISESTISGNSSNGFGLVPTSSFGGGILFAFSGGTPSYVITNSTISGNSATGSLTSGGSGGGIYADSSVGNLTITASTVAGNTAEVVGANDGTGGNLRIDGVAASQKVPLLGSIISGGSGAAGHENCSFDNPGQINSFDANVEGPIGSGGAATNQCLLAAVATDVHADPLLSPLSTNGGPSVGATGSTQPLQTHALNSGSPAIDRVPTPCTGIPATDERGAGFPRPSVAGTGCDSGSFEVQDLDGDGVLDASDNCRAAANVNQANLDGDSQGDVCDPDDDNDGAADGADNCPANSNGDQANTDGDAQGDVCDANDDNDTLADSADGCSTQFGPGGNQGCPFDLAAAKRKCKKKFDKGKKRTKCIKKAKARAA